MATGESEVYPRGAVDLRGIAYPNPWPREGPIVIGGCVPARCGIRDGARWYRCSLGPHGPETPHDFTWPAQEVNPSSDATLSPCGRYRYDLTRRWGPDPRFALWVMLNPSTADAVDDDPTIRRCAAFTRREGLHALIVVNLFALRTPRPAEVLRHPEPIGPRNDDTIRSLASRADLIVAAWGAHPAARLRAPVVASIVRRPMLCLGVTRAGAPVHSLYLPADAPLMSWSP